MKSVGLFVTLSASIGLSACSYSVPVTGTIGDTPVQGQATAKAPTGDFWVMSTTGLRCDGTYDSMTSAPTITAPVKCNDGRTGDLIITRTLDMLSGTVIGRLSDGTEGRFVFGNLTYAQAFGGTTAAIR